MIVVPWPPGGVRSQEEQQLYGMRKGQLLYRLPSHSRQNTHSRQNMTIRTAYTQDDCGSSASKSPSLGRTTIARHTHRAIIK